MYTDTTIVTPTFKEAKDIEVPLEKITAIYPGISVVVVDDGSRDGTQE